MSDSALADVYRKRDEAILAAYDVALIGAEAPTIPDELRAIILDELPSLAPLFDALLAKSSPPAEMLSRLFLRVTPILSLASLYTEQIRWSREIIDALGAGNHMIDVGLLNAVAYSLDALGDAERAVAQYNLLLELFADHPDHPALGAIWFNLSLHYYRAGNLIESLDAAEKSLEISEKHGDKRGMTIVLTQQAEVLCLLDKPALAFSLLHRAAELLDELKSADLELRYFEVVALLLAEYRPAHATAVFSRAIKMAEALQDHDTRARMLFNRAAYHHALGDIDAARTDAFESIAI